MGVPVVTFPGDRHAARMGASLLCAVGLEELIAADVAGYIDKAVALAGDLERLEALRGGLRERMQHSPLMDEAGFTRALEQSLIDVWQEKIRPQAGVEAVDDTAIAARMRRVSELRASGNKIEAEEACKEVLRARPDHMEALTALWDLSYETQNHGVAVEWLRRGIAANNAIPNLHYMMGYSLMGQGNMSDAVASFRAALALDPSMAKAHNNLGCALEAVGNLGEAVECYRRAAGHDPRLAD
jgi:predicted O-linked N-acetylglucosamine transferase (SPINDLY family)